MICACNAGVMYCGVLRSVLSNRTLALFIHCLGCATARWSSNFICNKEHGASSLYSGPLDDRQDRSLNGGGVTIDVVTVVGRRDEPLLTIAARQLAQAASEAGCDLCALPTWLFYDMSHPDCSCKRSWPRASVFAVLPVPA